MGRSVVPRDRTNAPAASLVTEQIRAIKQKCKENENPSHGARASPKKCWQVRATNSLLPQVGKGIYGPSQGPHVRLDLVSRTCRPAP